jgi:hypothetical protein
MSIRRRHVVRRWMTGEDEAAEGFNDDVSAASDNELVKLVNKIIVDAYQQGRVRYSHRTRSRVRKRR